ncbi:MAG: ABC transporter ATP-binding protein [Candidatus Wallbacteria bacterium]|nr:ABC transporter ATP-binding protein [Candidatus Wallbacteria bacterium]
MKAVTGIENSCLKKPKIYYWRWIWNYYRQYTPMILLLLLMTVLSTVVSVLFPRLFKHLIDTLLKNLHLFQSGSISMDQIISSRNDALVLLLLLGLASMAAEIYPFLRGRMNLIFEMAFRNRYFHLILNKSYRFFLRFRTGDLVTRLTEDIITHPPGISWFICSGIFRAFNSTCVIFFCLLSMSFMSPKLTLLSIAPLPFMVWLFLRLEHLIQKRFRRRQEIVSSTNDFLESAYSGIKIVKSFNSEEAQISEFENLLKTRIGVEIDVVKLHGLMQVYFEFLNYLGQVMVLLFGGMLVVSGEITIGTYYAFFSYLGMIVYPLVDIPTFFITAAQSFVVIDRLDDLEECDAAATSGKSGSPCGKLDRLEIKGLAFSYPATETGENTRPPFKLAGVDFELRQGEKVAVVGKIGSGKTTLLNLLSGFLEPSCGGIEVNGVTLKEIDIEDLRKKIGYVQQEPNVFSESIGCNIDFWRGNDQDWIRHCATLAQLDNEIAGFPAGYNELLGQRGITLSGGQRQRLSIARALAGRPELLLMDDVTSSLDAENEINFWKQVLDEFRDITCLIVTHRLSTAQRADRIIVMNSGSIEAMGTHAELMEKSVTYRDLVAR